MRALRVLLGSAALGLGAALLGQCFAPSYHDCAFRCNPTAPPCPDEYECRSDGYCHLRSSAADGFCALPAAGARIDAGSDAAVAAAVDGAGGD
jgi:hypothetical protein